MASFCITRDYIFYHLNCKSARGNVALGVLGQQAQDLREMEVWIGWGRGRWGMDESVCEKEVGW